MDIREDDLSGAAVRDLLREHLAGMAAYSPPDSVHALDIPALRAPGVTFWTAWEGDDLLGCGALRELDAEQGEIKSKRTTRKHLRRGAAAAILTHIIAVARARGYRRLNLETGSGAAFEPAYALYRRFGFAPCPAFGDYPPNDPFSRFLSLDL